MTKQPSHITACLKAFRSLRLPALFNRLKEKDILVMDGDVYSALVAETGPLNCVHVTPEQARKKLPPHLRRVVVFTLDHEAQLVNELKATYKRRVIFSITYDAALVSSVGMPRLRLQKTEQIDAPTPTVFISSPGSDAEYLSQVLDMNGLVKPQEYVGKFFLHILPHVKGFLMMRLLQNLLANFADAGPVILLQTDVIDALNMAMPRFYRKLRLLLRRNEVPVVYFIRRDKMFQASLMCLFEKRRPRSVWAMTDFEKQQFKPQAIPFGAAHQAMQTIITQESDIETILDQYTPMKMLTVEELVDNPKEVVQALAAFLNRRIPARVKTPDYGMHYRQIEGLVETALGFRRELIDRLGLHVNSAGSFATQTDDILRKNKKTETP